MNLVSSKILDFLYLKRQDFEYFFITVFRSLHARIYIFFIAVTNFLIWYIVRKIVLISGDDLVALHYSVETGIDFFGEAKKMYVLPFLGLFITLINFFICLTVAKHKDREFIGHVLFATSLVVNVILLIAALSLYLVNIQ